MTISTNLITTILIHPYAQKHFVKYFEKTYKSQRSQSREFIQFAILHMDNTLLSTKAEVINEYESGRIIKLEFKIAWSKESAKTSWNRMIIYHEYETATCHVLLVYHKGHIKWPNETAWWKKEVVDNCEVVREIM